MKLLLPTLLGLSLAANAALYLSAPSQTSVSSAAQGSARRDATSARSASTLTKDSSAPSIESGSPSPTALPADLWTQLQSGNPAAVERLRAAGFSEKEIRTLVLAQINELYRARERALFTDPTKAEYWKSDFQRAAWVPKDRRALLDLRREKEALTRQLLGADYVPERNWQETRYSTLPPDKAARVALIEEDYNTMIAEARGNSYGMNNVLLPEDREKIRYLEKERRAELAQTLSPEELFEYDVRNSTAASILRQQLQAFQPTEKEFREIFALRKAKDNEVGSLFLNSASDREARQKVQAEIDAQLKEKLSEERYAEYVRAKDYNYQRLHQIATRLQLPPERTLAAYEVSTATTKRLRELRSSTPADAEKIKQEQAALTAETETRLRELLGPTGYEAFKQNTGSSFIVIR